MDLFFTFIFFILACIFSFYIPGRVILEELKLKEHRLNNFFLSLAVGIALFTLTTYLLAYLNASQLYIAVLTAFSIFFIYKRKKYLKIDLKKMIQADGPFIAFILFGAVVFTIPMFFSGWMTGEGLQFYDTNKVDGILHFAFINNMMSNFPPTHPAVADIPLRGYHYFYDFLISRFALFYNLSPLDLFFRHFHFLNSLIYGGGFYLASQLITKERIKILAILFFAYFGQGFTYIVLLASSSHDSMYGLSQPLQLVFNPLLLFSLGLMLSALYLLPKIKNFLKYAAVAILIIGVISQFKIHAGLIGIAGVGIYTSVEFLKIRKIKGVKNYILALLGIGIITAATYLPANLGAGSLAFTPLILYQHFMTQGIFQHLNWEVRRQIFAADNNYIQLFILYGVAFALLWILGMGTRIIVAIGILRVVKKEFWKNESKVLIFSIIALPLVLGTFFVQTLSPLDTIQFYWIALFLLSIPSGIILVNVAGKFPKLLKTIFLGAVVLHAAVGVTYFIYDYYEGEPRVIAHNDLKAFETFAEAVPEGTYPVVIPRGYVDSDTNKVMLQWEYMPFVAAMTKRSTYYEHEVTPFNIPEIYEEREKNMNALFLSVKDCDMKRVEQALKYIGTEYIAAVNDYPCLENEDFSVISKGSEYSFYKFKK